MAVKPLEDRVLVKPIEAESKTASGIYLPEAAKEKPVRGKVVAGGRSETFPFRLPLDLRSRLSFIKMGLKLRSGVLRLRVVQREGGKAITAADYLNARRDLVTP